MISICIKGNPVTRARYICVAILMRLTQLRNNLYSQNVLCEQKPLTFIANIHMSW